MTPQTQRRKILAAEREMRMTPQRFHVIDLRGQNCHAINRVPAEGISTERPFSQDRPPHACPPVRVAQARRHLQIADPARLLIHLCGMGAGAGETLRLVVRGF
jgi:hypothetical protein